MHLKDPMILVDQTGSLDTFINNIHAVINAGAKSLLLFACDKNGFTPEDLNDTLRSLQLPVLGGVFPSIISQGQHFDRGSIVYGANITTKTTTVRGLSDESCEYASQMQALAETCPADASLMVIVDGLSSRITAFLEDCYDEFGADCNYVGGGAGSLSFEHKPSVFTENGLEQDCAQILVVRGEAGISCGHGLDVLAGPFLVSRSRNNEIHTLDYRPAYDVYKEVVEQATGKQLDEEEFINISKEFPFGLSQIDGEILVRDPLMTNDGKLICVGEVPENSLIHILQGKPEHLITAAKVVAVKLARGKTRQNPIFVFDCISRLLFLEDRFSETLVSMQETLENHGPLVGALSVGEITNNDENYLALHNKTTVLATLV